MSRPLRRSPESWRVPDRRVIRPELWIVAFSVVGMLLVDVWQSSRMAEISLALDQSRSALQQAHARLDFVRAELERRSTRAELAPLGNQLGLAPPDAQQVVVLPAEYLADGGDRRTAESVSRLAWAERVSRVLVPEARARGRSGN